MISVQGAMMHKALWVVGFLAAALPAGADTIFAQAPLDTGGVFLTGGDVGGLYFADDFGILSETRIDSITWWGGFLGSPGTSFDIRIFEDAGGTPGAALASVTGAAPTAADAGLSGDLAFGWGSGLFVDVYAFTYEFASPLELSAGQYYLSIHSTDSDFAWLVSAVGNESTWISDTPNPSWAAHDFDGDLAFHLDGATLDAPAVIPEPATLILIGLGLGGLALRGARGGTARG